MDLNTRSAFPLSDTLIAYTEISSVRDIPEPIQYIMNRELVAKRGLRYVPVNEMIICICQ